MELQVIKTEVILGRELRVFGDIENPLFLAKDIAEWIEHKNMSKMLEIVGGSKVVTSGYILTNGGNQEMKLLTEKQVYRILMRSDKPIAMEIQDGIFEFLKAWRKGEVKVVSTKDTLLLDIIKANSDVSRAVALSKYEEEYVRPLEIENKSLTKEVEHKEDVIIGLVTDIDLATKRQRITQVVKNNTKNYKDRYNLLYKEFELKYHMNLNRRLESETTLAIKPKIKNKMDFIDRGLGMVPELYEIACVLFETDMQEIIKRFER